MFLSDLHLIVALASGWNLPKGKTYYLFIACVHSSFNEIIVKKDIFLTIFKNNMSNSFIKQKMEGQVNGIALWDTVLVGNSGIVVCLQQFTICAQYTNIARKMCMQKICHRVWGHYVFYLLRVILYFSLIHSTRAIKMHIHISCFKYISQWCQWAGLCWQYIVHSIVVTRIAGACCKYTAAVWSICECSNAKSLTYAKFIYRANQAFLTQHIHLVGILEHISQVKIIIFHICLSILTGHRYRLLNWFVAEILGTCETLNTVL